MTSPDVSMITPLPCMPLDAETPWAEGELLGAEGKGDVEAPGEPVAPDESPGGTATIRTSEGWMARYAAWE
jgi:hypothetical protein